MHIYIKPMIRNFVPIAPTSDALETVPDRAAAD